MSKMWKPGTSKPNENGDTASSKSPLKATAKPPSNGSSATKKKLSGATMGMRFMQRKKEAEEARQKKVVEQTQQQESHDDQMEWTATETDNAAQGSADDNEKQPSAPQQMEATPSDMYGAKSDLIGRRSFGGFRPHVSDTYKSACQAWENGKIKDSKEHISDEELLRRYKNYVTGKGDMVDSQAAAPIGNLQEKVKKKGKRKNQTPHKGEKRKR